MIKKCSGFTLIELILVMVLMGILSATALPRLNFSSHSAAGCAETVKASLRLAQKLAIAERASAKLVTVANDCTVSVTGGETYPALTGVSVTNSGSVTFNGLGQPSLVTVRTFTISGGDVIRYVCLEPETGYVHEETTSCG
jgi:prepilin-type N-terminal cleavage/methylation domain-containing protein